MKRKILAASLILFAAFSMSGCGDKTVEKPCDWCGESPSIAYEKYDGTEAYACEACSEICMICDGEATIHFENVLGTISFVCDACYETVNE